MLSGDLQITWTDLYFPLSSKAIDTNKNKIVGRYPQKDFQLPQEIRIY